MPQRRTRAHARGGRRRSASSRAGQYVREEIHKIRRGEHGARSAKQAIAIGLSKARRAGVDLPPPARGKASERTRESAKRAYEAGHGHPRGRPSARRSRAISRALKREPRSTVSHAALARQAHRAAMKRSAAERSASARKAARTKGHAAMARAAREAARTRAHH